MNPNTGSFGAAISNGPQDMTALKEAMQRRGVDTSALDQMSGASVGGATPMPQPVSDLSAAQAAIPQEQSMPVPTTPEQPDSDARIALKALSKVVTDESSLKKDLVKGRMQGLI